MLVIRYLGFHSPVFLVVIVIFPVIVLILRRQWRHSVARSEEVRRLLISASEEAARVEFEAREFEAREFEVREPYYYSDNVTPFTRVPVPVPVRFPVQAPVRFPVQAPGQVPVYGSVPLSSTVKPQYECAVCFSLTTTRCANCKSVHYCSGKCQIIHWRQGHKDECRPYVSAGQNDNVGGGSYKQGSHKDQIDDVDTEAKQTVKPAERIPKNSLRNNDVGVEAFAHQQGFNSTSGSKSPSSYEERSVFSTPTQNPAAATLESFITLKSAHQNSVNSTRKSNVVEDNNLKIPDRSDEDTQSGNTRSSFSTDDGSMESLLSEPATTNSSGFWDGTIRKKKSSNNDRVDLSPETFGETANCYMANRTTKVAQSNNIMNGLGAAQAKNGSGLTDLRSKKSTDTTPSSKDMVNGMVNDVPMSRRPPASTFGTLNYNDGADVSSLPVFKFQESKKVLSGAASHIASADAGRSMPKNDKASGGLPPLDAERSNVAFGNKNTAPHITTFISRDKSHSTKPLKVIDDNHKVTSSQLADNSRSARSGSKMSKLKVVDHVKPSIVSRPESLERGSETIQRYSFKGLFPYEMFVKLYNWKQVELQPCGLRNCGNSCYANAVLQCLIYTPPLTAYLLEGIHSKTCDKRGWCFTCELQGLVMKAKNGYSPLSPIHILTHIENMGSNLGHGKEEDAHEFLRYVIDALQSSCIKEAGSNALNSLEEETTLIGLTFGGYLRSKIICMKCGVKSERHERMMDLTVEIEGDVSTLEGALDKFTSVEILEGENKYKCSRCKSYEKAKKKLTLLEAPNVLTIALKRFQSGRYGKLNKSVKFPEILDMAPYVSGTSDKSPIYRLYGVVVHLDTMNAAFSGHYVCYVKNLQNRWFKFDDSLVNEVDLQHVLTKGAYMLLYARCSPRAPRSIRSSLIPLHGPKKHTVSPSIVSKHSSEPWDPRKFHQQVQHRSLDEESSSSSDNSALFSESCSCSTDSTHRDSTTIEDHDYWKSINLSSSDSDSSSTSSFPSPLYSRLTQLYTSRTNEESNCKLSKVCRNIDCSCNCCRVTNLGSLGKPAANPTEKSGVTYRKSVTRATLD
ncbi:ubiquitin carboxyl-terminal hydrolase 17-like [Rutidosis leptorrhynchoides]|uniref:ubiquitin carboxyl-terminal hydrolase 17-like n=1 Tax=Rutidosis leptorrhynchoides TaxID=125765 RepID=UPI003A996AB7